MKGKSVRQMQRDMDRRIRLVQGSEYYRSGDWFPIHRIQAQFQKQYVNSDMAHRIAAEMIDRDMLEFRYGPTGRGGKVAKQVRRVNRDALTISWRKRTNEQIGVDVKIVMGVTVYG